MSNMNLSESEIYQRLTRLRNLERLHLKARERIVSLEKENKALKQRIRKLEDKNTDQNGRIEALSFQFEQIKNKLFGKKPVVERILHKKERRARDTFSYHRPIPAQVTKTEQHPVSGCFHCHGKLSNKSIRAFFEEDIPIPIQKIVVRHDVEVGYCKKCKRQSSGRPIPSKKAVLGEHVRKYVCLLSIANRLPHAQIQGHLKDVFDLVLSMGEIGNMLQAEADDLRPAYERLKVSVMSQEAVHYDETSWKVQKEGKGKYAWVATGTENNDTVFSMGKSRGRGNVEELGVAKVGISDDYGVYKNAFAEHQLCWAHPQRKLRDVVESKAIEEGKRTYCTDAYIRFSTLYKRITRSCGQHISSYLKRTFQTEFDRVSEHHALDPTPLAKIKESLRKNKDKYFTFLAHPNIPIDNNKAERALRHLVIKRKISFGSKTERGADTTAILASVILSLRWNDPEKWFEKYLALKA
jgi:transposase